MKGKRGKARNKARKQKADLRRMVIRGELLRRGWTIASLAQQIGVDRTYVLRVLYAERDPSKPGPQSILRSIRMVIAGDPDAPLPWEGGLDTRCDKT